MNRFTPTADQFPFSLNQIQVGFSSLTGVQVGDQIELVVYENTSGNTDPAVGSNLLATFPATVQALDAWNVYDLSTPVSFAGPGDVLIGVIALELPGTPYFPADIDTTVSQQRSWLGWWSVSPPPTPPTLPSDDTWMLIDGFLPGNWLIRGYGDTVSEIQVSFNVTVTAEAGTTITNTADLNYNGDMYMADSVFNVVAPPTAMFTSNSPIMLGDTAMFTPTVTGTGPFDYMWDFGDEITSTMEAPTHTYMMTGTYTVTLMVTSMYGMDSYSAEFVVNPAEMMMYKIYLPTVARVPSP